METKPNKLWFAVFKKKNIIKVLSLEMTSEQTRAGFQSK